MYRSRIPAFAKLFLPQLICRVSNAFEKDESAGKKIVYLTFDDGPIPESTPNILDILKQYGVKATFFCVGENVMKHPLLYKQILEKGHFTGNHTYNHLNGWKTPTNKYMENVNLCEEQISSTLFRPPYGKITLSQYHLLKKKFKLILWDVLIPDFDLNSSVTNCMNIVKEKTRSGSILVFHDNLKAKNKLTELLPGALDYLIQKKFDIQPVTNNILK
jgi:peptidoglycan-N-acetylglucosamine deacetylase